jgi:hypothetical protein
MLLAWLVLGLVIGAGLAQIGMAGGVSDITAALSAQAAEIDTGVKPAIVGVLVAFLVIGLAAAVVRVISRNS